MYFLEFYDPLRQVDLVQEWCWGTLICSWWVRNSGLKLASEKGEVLGLSPQLVGSETVSG